MGKVERPDWKGEPAEAVVKTVFDQQALWDETFRRLHSNTDYATVLREFNAASIKYDEGEITQEEYDAVAERYFAEVLAPISVEVAREILQTAIERAGRPPYGTEDCDD